MSEIDWSKAPEWATVYLHNVGNTDVFAWAESFTEGAKFVRTDTGLAYPELMTCCWDVVAERPTAWNGDGLPPVGTVCEMQDDVGRWIKVEIIASHAGFSHGWEASSKESFYSDKPEEFRPIRTPEQIAAEEREKAIEEMLKDAGYTEPKLGAHLAVANLYDAGYRKQPTNQPQEDK